MSTRDEGTGSYQTLDQGGSGSFILSQGSVTPSLGTLPLYIASSSVGPGAVCQPVPPNRVPGFCGTGAVCQRQGLDQVLPGASCSSEAKASCCGNIFTKASPYEGPGKGDGVGNCSHL